MGARRGWARGPPVSALGSASINCTCTLMKAPREEGSVCFQLTARQPGMATWFAHAGQRSDWWLVPSPGLLEHDWQRGPCQQGRRPGGHPWTTGGGLGGSVRLPSPLDTPSSSRGQRRAVHPNSGLLLGGLQSRERFEGALCALGDLFFLNFEN